MTQWILESDVLERDPDHPDPHKLLAGMAGEEDVYEMMASIPEDKIGEVLAWALNVDIRLRA
ncbi:MAG: hypothetical protein JW797_12660 [Bradymonadales bacterium]|nr:hypothetical protein [Bradymonadales bacterium]